MQEEQCTEKTSKSNIMDCLERFRNSGKVVSLYSDPDNTNKFSCGYILDFDDTYLLMAHIGPVGEYDGYGTIVLDDIYLVGSDRKYENKIEILHSFETKKHIPVKRMVENVILNLLLFAQNESLIVVLDLFSSGLDDVQGFVSSIEDDNDTVTIRTVDEYGEENGSELLSAANIAHIFVDTRKESAIKKLHDYNLSNSTT